MKKVACDKTIIPSGCRAYTVAKEQGKSFTIYVLVSNFLGILGYNLTYDTSDRWMFLHHLKLYLEKYAFELLI